MTQELELIADKAAKICEVMQWKRDWSDGGCYLHLEASEFIEALRGKGGDDPTGEAADVLFVLFGMLRNYGITPTEVIKVLDEKCDEIISGSRTFPGGLGPRTSEIFCFTDVVPT